MKKRYLIKALLFVCLGLMFASCSSPRTAGTNVVSMGSGGSGKIRENSWLLAHNFHITEVNKATVNGLLKVDVVGENDSEDELQFEYSFKWIDANGQQVNSISSTWNTVQASSKEAIRMPGVAPTEEVTDFDFVVRFPDRH